MVHLSHYDILKFFNSKVTGILNAYSFAGNYSSLSNIIWILRQSCALTLARKFKLKTLRKTFGTYGFDLTDPETGLSFKAPKSFVTNQDFGKGFKYNDPNKYDFKKLIDLASEEDVFFWGVPKKKEEVFEIPDEIENNMLETVNKVLNKS